jgi:hypothetical protein
MRCLRAAASVSVVVGAVALVGCTVGAVPPADDGGIAPACETPLPGWRWEHGERVQCPIEIELPTPSTDRARAAFDEIRALADRLCEEDARRASTMDDAEWQRWQEERAPLVPGQLEVEWGPSIRLLAPLPHEDDGLCSIEAHATTWLARHRIAFLVDGDLELVPGPRVEPSDTRVRFVERWRGVPVRWRSLTFEWDQARGRFASIEGSVATESQMPASELPAIDEATALRVIDPSASHPSSRYRATLAIEPGDGLSRGRLVYLVTAGITRVVVAVVDATDGSLVRRESRGVTADQPLP